jgi:hypothetical protein
MVMNVFRAKRRIGVLGRIIFFLVTAISVSGYALSNCPPTPYTCSGPISGLDCVDVEDCAAPYRTLTQADIDVAIDACDTGCNLHFLTGVYQDVRMIIGSFPDGFAMYGEGIGETTLRAPVYGGDFDPEDPEESQWHPTIHITGSAPDGVIIEDLTLDGRKFDQVLPDDEYPSCLPDDCTCPPPWGQPTCHNGGCCVLERIPAITTNNPGLDIREDGVIRNIEIKDYLASGITFEQTEDWTIEDCEIHNIGCNTADESCASLGNPDNWNTAPDIDGVTNRKTNGFGIEVGQFNLRTEILNNLVTDTTKVGIVTYSSSSKDCTVNDPVHGKPAPPRETYFYGNTVEDSAAGFYVNGGCDTVFEDNTATGSFESSRSGVGISAGFACSDGGLGTQFKGNTSQNNEGAGFLIWCPDGEILLEDNVTHNNCTDESVPEDSADLDLNFCQSQSIDCNPLQSGVPDITIKNHQVTSESNLCRGGIQIRGFDEVHIDGGAILGGDGNGGYGIFAEHGHRLRIEDIDVKAGEGDVGMWFGYGLSEVYVQATADFDNFTTETQFDDGSLNDGDDVAYCSLETRVYPDPQCCANLFPQDVCITWW